VDGKRLGRKRIVEMNKRSKPKIRRRVGRAKVTIMRRSIIILVLFFSCIDTYCQHTLKQFTGSSDFGIADAIIQEGAFKGSLKTRGTVIFDPNSLVITLQNFSVVCTKNVVLDNPTIHIKGKVSIKTKQLTIKRDCIIDFADSESRLVIEYEEMDDATSEKKITITKLHHAQITLKKVETTCD
jgi:hypothetical protein